MFVVMLLCALLLVSCNEGPAGSGGAAGTNRTASQSQLDGMNETDGSAPAAANPAGGVEAEAGPAGGTSGNQGRTAVEEAAPVLTPELAETAVAEFRAGLRDSKQWSSMLHALVRLPEPTARLFKADVEELVAGADQPESLELAALMKVDPEAGHRRIGAGLAQGDLVCIQALVQDSESGHELLGLVELGPEDTAQANLCLDLLRTWGGARPGDDALLRKLLKSADMTVVYRAMGHLLALGEGGEAEFDALKDAVLGRTAGWVGAIEGMKISGDGRFAGALVPLASKAELLGDSMPEKRYIENPEDQADKEPDPAAVRMAAYALTYLPGEQAQLVRRKLLKAKSPRVRWQARLGELLHGDPGPWHDAVAAEGYSSDDLWTALEPPEAVHRELLPLYAAASCSDDALLRFKAANQLNRYNGIASGERAARILARLLEHQDSEQDNNPAVVALVRLKALITAGDLMLPQLVEQVTGIMNDDKDDSRLYRPAAAYYLLAVGRLPAPGPEPESEGSDR